jgi:hypothetical protein
MKIGFYSKREDMIHLTEVIELYTIAGDTGIGSGG